MTSAVYNIGSVFRTADALIEKIYLCGITNTSNKEENSA
jgi:hypothetical protein